MSEKPSPHLRPTSDPLEAVAQLAAQQTEIVGRGVRQGGGVQVGPERLQRIQFRSIRGQPLHGQPVPMTLQRVGHTPTAMRGQPIPQEDHPTPDMPAQGGQEARDVWPANRAAVQREQPTRLAPGGRRQHRADGRQMLPVERLPHQGRAPFGGPGCPNGRPLGEAALVEEAQRGLQPVGFFLIRGHVVRTQCAMAASSRSRARRAGRWRLHPNWCKSRHVCGTEYRT